MARVYLETSFFSACVSRRTSAKIRRWRALSLEWWNTQRYLHDNFISFEVSNELSDPAFPQSNDAIAMVPGLENLAFTETAARIAHLLVNQKLMPGPATSGDSVHVAVAMVHRMDYILTWNVRHLANPNKRVHLASICMTLGLPTPMIVTPEQILRGSR